MIVRTFQVFERLCIYITLEVNENSVRVVKLEQSSDVICLQKFLREKFLLTLNGYLLETTYNFSTYV